MKTCETQNYNPNVRVIHLGRGKVVSNYGTYFGTPSIFLEPVIGEAGPVGQVLRPDEEPQISDHAVSSGGIILCFHSPDGASIILEDIQSALNLLCNQIDAAPEADSVSRTEQGS